MKAALFMLAALPLLAADAGHSPLRGKILDGQGSRQIANAIVTVSTNSGYVASVETNKDGEFKFASLPAGDYGFRVTAHGYAIYERPMTVSVNGGVKVLDVRLLVPVNAQTVSVAELLNVPSSRGSAAAGY